MIKNNKLLSLTIIGVVLGGIIGTVVNLHEINTLTVGAFGGLAGFLAGWIWTSRSDESKE